MITRQQKKNRCSSPPKKPRARALKKKWEGMARGSDRGSLEGGLVDSDTNFGGLGGRRWVRLGLKFRLLVVSWCSNEIYTPCDVKSQAPLCLA